MSGTNHHSIARGRKLATVAATASFLAVSVAMTAGAEIQSIESVGTAPLPASPGPGFDPRGEALDAAIAEAVIRVAEELIGEDGTGPIVEREQLEVVVGEAPRRYAARFKLLEDRGERAALFADDESNQAGTGREYVVVAAVDVDVDLVRRRLEAARFLEERGESPSRTLRLEVQGLDSHGAYAAFTKALARELGRDRIIPVEIERGRATFEIQTPLELDRLLARLRNRGPADLDVVRLAPNGRAERLAVRWSGGQG